MTSETNSDKVIAFIVDIQSGSETALLCTEICEDLWIAESGSLSHMTNTLQGMYNQRKISSKVKIGSSNYMAAIIIGDVSSMEQKRSSHYVT